MNIRERNNGLHISVEINNSLVVNANPILLESLISNLIVNSIRHNRDNGLISITVSENVFSIKNTGNTTSLDESKIFRRFSRPSEEKKGNGLGLSIVSQTCLFHGWKIEYEYLDKLHTFVVWF